MMLFRSVSPYCCERSAESTSSLQYSPLLGSRISRLGELTVIPVDDHGIPTSCDWVWLVVPAHGFYAAADDG